ncbi:MAG: hypothetical protein Q6363_003400 [Candidatus Njordarchaeota archaeon]
MVDAVPGIDILIRKLEHLHPSHHAARGSILKQIVIVIDNWIRKNGTSEQCIIIIAKTLDKINRRFYYAFSEMLKMTKYPRIYQQAINHLRWARLHKKMGGALAFDI